MIVTGATTGARMLLVAGGSGQPLGQTGATFLDGISLAELTPVSGGFSIGSFTRYPGLLGTARAEIQGRLMTPAWIDKNPPGHPWLLFGPGNSDGPAVDGWRVDVSVPASPSGFVSTTGSGTPVPPGAAFFVGATSVLAVAGGGSPAALAAPVVMSFQGHGLEPSIGGWGALTNATPITPVTHMATAQDGPFCYLIGGDDASGTAVGDVQLTIR